MLKKLFKYDWRSCWKVPAAVNLFLVLITLVGIISMVSPFWEQGGELIQVLRGTAMMLYIVAIFAGSFSVSIYIAIRYYKGIYTDEGYLTNTLPVTPRQLILSRLLVGVIWITVTGLVVCISCFSIISTAAASTDGVNLMHEVIRAFDEASLIFKDAIGMSLNAFLLLVAVYAIIGTFFSVLMFYSAISLGQLFTGHKVMGSVIWYIAEYIIIQTASSLLINVPLSLSLYNTDNVGMLFKSMLFSSLIISIIFCVLMFLLSEYMLKKKLNLD